MCEIGRLSIQQGDFDSAQKYLELALKKNNNHHKTSKGSNTKKSRGTNKKNTRKTSQTVNVNTISYYNKPPEVVTINGYKFLLLPVKKGSLMVTCKIFGGTYLENKKNILIKK